MSIDAGALFAAVHISNAETGNICIEMQKGFVVCWVFSLGERKADVRGKKKERGH